MWKSPKTTGHRNPIKPPNREFPTAIRMLISVVTLFPDMVRSVLETSIIGRAIDKGTVTVSYINPRDFATDAYKTVDDHPYGGGIGMVLKVDILDKALSHAIDASHIPREKTHVILTDPRGKPFRQASARSLTSYEHLVFLCGHYEGVDERVRSLADEEISIGDFVVTGGEIPAVLMIDAIVRLIPGVLKHDAATRSESFEEGLLEYPQYTRPLEYKGVRVPDVLLSGDHKKIEAWRIEHARDITSKNRPDLIKAKTDRT